MHNASMCMGVNNVRLNCNSHIFKINSGACLRGNASEALISYKLFIDIKFSIFNQEYIL